MPPRCLAVLAATATLLAFDGGLAQQPQSNAPSAGAGAPAAIADEPIDAYRLELLDLAFDAVSKMPLVPHVKNRSRAQYSIVETGFQLHQPRRALAYSGRIADWHRGLGYAEYARVCAEQGLAAEAQRYLQLAAGVVAELQRDQNQQEWRGDRVRAHMARVQLLLGNKGRADELAHGVGDAELSIVGSALAERLQPSELDNWLKSADALFATGDFEHARNAILGCVVLFDRFYRDEALRAQFEQRAVCGFAKLPVEVRLQTLARLTDAALQHGDQPKARELLAVARQRLAAVGWQPEDEVRLSALLAGLRHRAGETDAARRDAMAALQRFDQAKEQIVNMFRADALVPLAEAFHTIGDDAMARSTYRRAIEESVENPNSRPRGDDLVLVCLSMATQTVEPDAELKARLAEVAQSLGSPTNPW